MLILFGVMLFWSLYVLISVPEGRLDWVWKSAIDAKKTRKRQLG